MYSYNKNKRKLNYMILIIMILVISIGYAILSTNINIVGSSQISAPTWNIHWENVSVKSGSVSAQTPTIDTNKTTVNYSVTLTIPGEYYEFTVDAVNAGTIVGMVSVVSNKLNNVEISTLPNYLEYKVSYEDGIDIAPNHLLASGTSEKYKVHVGYKKDISVSDIPEGAQTLNLSFSVTYVQSDNNAVKPAHPESFETDSWQTIVTAVQNNYTSVYNVGDTKTIDMGTLGTHTLRIANKSTPTECSTTGFSQTACGFVLEFVDIIESKIISSVATNIGGWSATELRTYLNSTFLDALPLELKNGIKDTYTVGGYGPAAGETLSITIDKIYLLNYKEVANYTGSIDTSNSYTRQLDFYSSLGVTTSNPEGAGKKYNGTDMWWWLRSAHATRNEMFTGVSSSGGISSGYSYTAGGVSPAFRIG